MRRSTKAWGDHKNKRTYLIKTIMELGELDHDDVADCLGVSKDYLYIKNSMNRYTIDEMMMLLDRCGFRILLEDRDHKIFKTIIPADFIDKEKEDER